MAILSLCQGTPSSTLHFNYIPMNKKNVTTNEGQEPKVVIECGNDNAKYENARTKTKGVWPKAKSTFKDKGSKVP